MLLKSLVKKTVIIFVILGSRKTQALLSETSEIIVSDKNKVVFLTKIKLKRRLLKPSIHQGYLLNKKLVNSCMKDFVIIYGQLQKSASSGIILKWIKEKLSITGIIKNVYKAHSSLSTSTGKASKIVLKIPTF